jgi:hypothetical protein
MLTLKRTLFAKMDRLVYSKIHTNLIKSVGKMQDFVMFNQMAYRFFDNRCVYIGSNVAERDQLEDYSSSSRIVVRSSLKICVATTWCPRKCAHFLNISVDKLNTSRTVQFSPEETAVQKVFPTHFLHFIALRPDRLFFFACKCVSGF